jgi:hypothetical protein
MRTVGVTETPAGRSITPEAMQPRQLQIEGVPLVVSAAIAAPSWGRQRPWRLAPSPRRLPGQRPPFAVMDAGTDGAGPSALLRSGLDVLQLSYMSDLSVSLTIRLSSLELRRLRERARAAKTTPSAVVRALLEKDLAQPERDTKTLGARSSRWVGAVRDSRIAPAREAREALAGWQPDRRG